MASKSHDLTHGPLVQQIILFSLPLMATNVLQVLFNMSDVAVVGQFAGPEALGSVGSTSILVSLFTGFLIGMGSGVNVVVARYIGARHDQDVHEAVHTSLILSLIVGVIIMALGFLFTPAMLSMLGTKPVLMAGAVSYLRIYCLGMPAMAVFNFGNAVLSAAGDTKKPLYFLSMAGVINILLNLFFVIVCHLAAAGVALASIISQYISAALVILSLRRSGSVVRLERSMLRIEPHKAKQVLSLSIPAGLQNAIFAIANLFIQAGVNSFDELMVEGNAAAANADACLRRDGCHLHRLLVLHEPELRRGQTQAHHPQLLHLDGVLLRHCPCHECAAGHLRAAVPRHFHKRRGSRASRDDPPAHHGLLLRLLRLHGLHHCREPRAGQELCADGYRDYGFVRVPHYLGVHGVCVLPHH